MIGSPGQGKLAWAVAGWARPWGSGARTLREPLLLACMAGSIAALLCWAAPPGTDFAAHAYQRTVFLDHGFQLWNNFWYAGHYSFVTYSLLYYPLAALFGIRLLAVATIAAAALAFAVVLGREWGPTARWSSRTFAVVWAGIVLSAAFPFALGVALALLALWALQARAHGRFACLTILTLAASPLAFLLLALVLAGLGAGRVSDRRRIAVPALVVAAGAAVELLLWRLFPDGGRYPFSPQELAAACVFCLFGIGLTIGAERARSLLWVFAMYLFACIAAYVVPSSVGENIARLRFAAVPITVLALSLRGWRPRLVALTALGLAISWNVTPLIASFAKGRADPASEAAYWQPAIRFLHRHLTPSYRVEAVDTAGHWDAVYLPRAGIPLARGWFRQDDFPQNRVLYSTLGPRAYVHWLRSLGVRYVVRTSAPPDYSARGEAALLAGGHSGLQPVLRTPQLTIYEVPLPRPLVTGPVPARVVAFTQTTVTVALAQPGRYRLAVRYSPYWEASAGCLARGKDGMIRLTVRRAATVALHFHVDAGGALSALAGRGEACAR